MVYIISFKQVVLSHFQSRCSKFTCLDMKQFYSFFGRGMVVDNSGYSLFAPQDPFSIFLCPSLSPGRLTSLSGSSSLPYHLPSIWVQPLGNSSRILEKGKRKNWQGCCWAGPVFFYLRLQLLHGSSSIAFTIFQ